MENGCTNSGEIVRMLTEATLNGKYACVHALWVAHLLHRKMYACRVSSDRAVPRDPSPSICTTSTPVGSPVKWAQGSATAKERAAVEEAPAVDVSGSRT